MLKIFYPLPRTKKSKTMLTQFYRLKAAADGRYATPEELQFLKDYFKSFNLRLSAYQKIRAGEPEIIRKALQGVVLVAISPAHVHVYFVPMGCRQSH